MLSPEEAFDEVIDLKLTFLRKGVQVDEVSGCCFLLSFINRCLDTPILDFIDQKSLDIALKSLGNDTSLYFKKYFEENQNFQWLKEVIFYSIVPRNLGIGSISQTDYVKYSKKISSTKTLAGSPESKNLDQYFKEDYLKSLFKESNLSFECGFQDHSESTKGL